jgi:transcriptional regulator with XRE-family HTH domain
MTIVIDFESKTTLQFHTSTLKELRTELKKRLRGKEISLGEIITELEKTISQKQLAIKLGVSARMLRYIKTGKRLIEPKKGIGKKARVTGVRSRLLNFAQSKGIRMTKGGFTSESIRSYTLLDFVCIAEGITPADPHGEIAKDIHEEFFSHYTNNAKEVMLPDYYQIAQQNIRDSISSMCEDGKYCDNVVYYSRGNKNPKQDKNCSYCSELLVSNGNKKLLYTALLKK